MGGCADGERAAVVEDGEGVGEAVVEEAAGEAAAFREVAAGEKEEEVAVEVAATSRGRPRATSMRPKTKRLSTRAAKVGYEGGRRRVSKGRREMMGMK